MSVLFKTQTLASSGARLVRRAFSGASPSILRRWDEPAVELALWHRSWGPALVEQLDSLAFSELPRARFTTQPDSAEISVQAALVDTVCGDEVLLGALTADIESLIARFARATNSSEIEVRLEAICDDACRLFHTDRMRARLVTTYLGPGTE